MKKTILLVGLLGLMLLPVHAQVDSIFLRGVEAYQQEDYAGAAELWQKIEKQGIRSAAVYYNLGNACYRLGRMPEAILYYERASLLKPGDEDIAYNLEMARAWQEDKLSTVPDLFIVSWYRNISRWFDSNQWASGSLIAFGLLFLCLLLFLLSRRYRVKKVALSTSILFLLLALLSMQFSLANRRLIQDKSFGIIFSPSVTAKNTPSESGTDLFIIHEGLKVEIEDKVNKWLEIRLPDGKVGWVKEDVLEKI